MRVAVVNTFDVKDIKNWSGIPYHISLFLEDMFGKENVECIAIPLKRNVFSYLKGFYVNRLIRKNYLSDFDAAVLSANYKAFGQVRSADYDLIITFEFFIIPGIKTQNNKIIFWSDATFQNLLNFYQYVSNLPSSHIKKIHQLQKKALELSDVVIFSSEWAINSAARYYQINPEKLKLVPFTSNLSSYPKNDEIIQIISDRLESNLKLLFLGIDWDRKGGDEAVEVLNQLNAKGLKVELYVVGVDVPEKYKGNANIIPLGFINKHIAGGEEKIKKLLSECSFLILPTKADCTPVAFSEANSFALPVITTDMGGIASVIKNDVNGFCFETKNFTKDAALVIERLWTSASDYKNLCLSSYRYYNDELSATVVKREFNMILKEEFALAHAPE